jgi:hypothetical protein
MSRSHKKFNDNKDKYKEDKEITNRKSRRKEKELIYNIDELIQEDQELRNEIDFEELEKTFLEEGFNRIFENETNN